MWIRARDGWQQRALGAVFHVLPDATANEEQQAEQWQAASEAQDRPEHDRRAHEFQTHSAHQQRRHRHVDCPAGRPPGTNAEEEWF